MKCVKDILTGDCLWAAFKLPGSNVYTIQKIEISEGTEGGWVFVRQDLKTSPIKFIGHEIYFKGNKLDFSEKDYIKYNGIMFFTEKEGAMKYVRDTIAEESQRIHKEIQKLVEAAYDLTHSYSEIKRTNIMWEISYPIIYTEEI